MESKVGGDEAVAHEPDEEADEDNVETVDGAGDAWYKCCCAREVFGISGFETSDNNISMTYNQVGQQYY
ncbi:hypothetical protein BLOT_004575 [Blomia tropicalis]|nr:hypothetical protein BLOT_004575 [Blomia tropicalis]